MCQVRIGEALNKRYLLTRDILFGTVLPQLILGAFICALIWFGVSRALHPLTQLTTQIRHMNDGSKQQGCRIRVDFAAAPDEQEKRGA